MKTLHFFKANSRIGLLNAPVHKNELNIGVEDGPDAILTPDYLATIGNPPVDEYTYAKPEAIEPNNFNITLAKQNKVFTNLIIENLKHNEVQAVLGGDHSVTFASINALLSRIDNPAELGYIQIDSHGDMHTYDSSPSKNFHGMYLRPFLAEDFDIPEIQSAAVGKLLPQNMWFIGTLDLEPSEHDFFFDTVNIKNTTPADIDQNRTAFLEELTAFVAGYKYLHVSFDIDGLDGSIAPATGIPAPAGLLKEHYQPILEIISGHPQLSFDLVEVNPRREGAEQTIQVARNILTSIALGQKLSGGDEHFNPTILPSMILA
jgi:arginase